ncbi:MAG TPA: VWA domain-containing protein [Roseiflexaceae bacterium]|nr:VWA domain-containing protein [Roseiflexaceae bacterium]
MHISFVAPTALWLLLILLPIWAVAMWTPRRLNRTRFWSSLVLRTAMIIALTLAVAGVQIVRSVDDLTTVFLIDSSDSVSPSARGQAEAFVQDAMKGMKPNDKAAVVVFGENALVERTPSDTPVLGRLSSVPVAARTDIQSALQLGMAMLPADTKKRMVLLSDGGENSGNAVEAARLAAARDIPISFVDLGSSNGGEAMIDSLSAPANVRQGQEVELVATVNSTVAQPAQLRIFNGDKVILDQQVQLAVGTNSYSLKVPTKDVQGFQRFRAEIQPQIDTRAQNNQTEALVHVNGVPRVLLVEGQPGEAQNFKDALTAANVTAEVTAPDAMPTELSGLSDYEAVVLVNVAARDLPVKAMANLPAYVKELGKGLIMIGGNHSFGVGGYGRTPVEDALPVYMDVRDRQERPDLALVFVIDKSGSMDACHCSGPNRQTSQFRRGGTPKIDIAKDAVAQATQVLQPNDTVGVVAFDGNSHWIVPAQRDLTVDKVTSALAPVAPEGGTNIKSGLLAAEDALKNTDARIKHVILLTDGWSGGGDNLDVANRMREEGMTLSVVAAGGGSADQLQTLATQGGGRYYPADNMEDVPQIFVQETITAVGNYMIEEPFTPKYAGASPVLDQLNQGLPTLYGYNGTTPKDTATVALTSADESPVLAQWQYGLGRAIAWTSDVEGKWAKDWVQWPEFPRFAAQMVNWVLPSSATANSISSAGMQANFHTEGAQTILDATVQDAGGKPRNNLAMQATILQPDGSSKQVPLTQIAPGEYRASIASPMQGTYIVQMVGSAGGQIVVQDTAGMVVPYSPEYRQGQSNPLLLETLAKETHGARLTQPADAFSHNLADVSRAQEIGLPLVLLALLLLPIDIGVRRLVLRRSDFGMTAAMLRGQRPLSPVSEGPAAQRARGKRTEADDETLERLLAAKHRARKRARGEEE